MGAVSGAFAAAMLVATSSLVGSMCFGGCAAAPPPLPSGTSEDRTRDLDASSDERDANDKWDEGTQPSLGLLEAGAAFDASNTVDDASDAALPLLLVSDETPYPPGGRGRAPGAANASSEDENIARWNRGGFGPTSAAGATDPSDAKPLHPAPRVKVDVLKVVGRIEEPDVLRVARSKGYWPYRLCFEEGLRRDQKLHGSVRFRVTVDRAGAVHSVQRIRAELNDEKVVVCVLRAAKGVALPRPAKGAPQITFEVSFWPGDEPVYTAKPASILEQDSRAVLSSLRNRLDAVRDCYAEGQRRRPGLWGRLALRLRLVGRVWRNVTEIESRFPDPAVASCVVHTFDGAEGPELPRELVVVYPLRLGAMRLGTNGDGGS